MDTEHIDDVEQEAVTAAIPEPLSAGKTAAVILVSLVVMVALTFGSIAAASALEGSTGQEKTEAASSSTATEGDPQGDGQTADQSQQANANAVAAVVNGEPIMEQDVTAYIEDFRADTDLTDDEAWGQWMVSYGYTPETVRQDVVSSFVYQALYEMAAQELQVEVTQADIDAALAEVKGEYESEEEYQQSMAEFGITEDELIQNELVPSLLEQKIIEAALGDKADDEEAFYEWLQNYWDQKGVVINDMPAGLSYDIDLTPYEQAAAEASEGSSDELMLGEGDEGELDLSGEEGDEGEIIYLDEDGNEIPLDDLEAAE